MKTILYLLMLTFVTSALAQEDVGSRSAKVASLKITLESVIDRGPYKDQQQNAIKAYFAELDSLIQDLSDYPKYLRKFNQYLRNTGIDPFCKSTILDLKRWSDLMNNCTKNGFFLCSEDVKNYPTTKLTLQKSLDDDNKTEMTKLPSCK